MRALTISSARAASVLFRTFAADNAGTSAIEYALLTFIAVAIIAIVSQLGGTLGALYQSIADAFAG